ncbi:type II secretion system F family protein [Basilea psittacipulmonis]|uniref:Type II secretion system protein GspF domain-containing protein n=1 Tax=Basilea psittacipulmonis DSM 24701 TaxID=1072685 RepID=A0A077DCV8_9BURK|nr:type II secretion system F family protein [Basilea psittacipulmonis]AIL32439.1 hypothetical protein IX83_03175 [Basilea psittacipulmonis DSM 24701]
MIFLLTLFLIMICSIVIWLMIHFLSDSWRQYQSQFEKTAEQSMYDFFLFLDVNRLRYFVMGIAVMIWGFVYLFTSHILLAILISLVSLFMPFYGLKILHARRMRQYEEQLPDFLSAIASALLAGSSLQMALNKIVPTTKKPLLQEFSLLMRQVQLGASLYEALDDLAKRIPGESNELMISAFKTSLKNGGNLAQLLFTISQTIRQRYQISQKIKALTSQGKMQAWVMGALPLLIVFAMSFIDEKLVGYFYQSWVGWLVIAFVLILELVGLVMIRKIVGIKI